MAVLLVGAVFVAARVMKPSRSGADSLAQAMALLPRSASVAYLEQKREQLIVMNAAVRTLAVASKPTTVDAAQVIASQSAAANSGAGGPTVTMPPADPAAAQTTAFTMMPSFGFSQKTQWTCLLNLWNRESSWIYYATNPTSGAYGIPQAFPGYKMAAAGADWQTNPATQIKWGLGYIKTVYGTPCVAYNFDVANGGY